MSPFISGKPFIQTLTGPCGDDLSSMMLYVEDPTLGCSGEGPRGRPAHMCEPVCHLEPLRIYLKCALLCVLYVTSA
jgi:hypothetical protein